MKPIVKAYTQSQLRPIPDLAIGDTLEVRVRIVEGEKERLQKFGGTLIARSGSGISETITVRRIVQGEGVECVFPLHSPKIESIRVIRHGRVRRAKLYYLRERVGKGVRLRERIVTTREGETEEPAPAESSAPETAGNDPADGKGEKKPSGS
jgi:large subunit ribosomal protein L19